MMIVKAVLTMSRGEAVAKYAALFQDCDEFNGRLIASRTEGIPTQKLIDSM